MQRMHTSNGDAFNVCLGTDEYQSNVHRAIRGGDVQRAAIDCLFIRIGAASKQRLNPCQIAGLDGLRQGARPSGGTEAKQVQECKKYNGSKVGSAHELAPREGNAYHIARRSHKAATKARRANAKSARSVARGPQLARRRVPSE